MATPFATIVDLKSRPSALTEAQMDGSGQLLKDASLWMRVWFPGAADAIGSNEDLAEALSMVCCSMVKRALIAGEREGLTSHSETIDGYAEQVVLSNPDGNLYVTNAEKDLIEKLLEVKTVTAVSMTMRGT
ncbi:hypothetical protein FFI94_022210 [Rhodococcus sp. KBS0724]|uniref:hypothetical protein n=1 Tax=Rhodococcus sp. KBS0724 TaxID=1179674 RepID=UPI00110E4CC8|nr:hypothetical protein [Rhodococcus sp. KBS0724]TSD48580.1 hypothetical protein FFI94_022210 [Rhodococcus sp. KBS0724]